MQVEHAPRGDHNSWSENTLTYNNKPSLNSTVIGTMTNPSTINSWYEINLTTSAVASRSGQTYSIGMDTAGNDGVWFYSKNNSTNKEELVITYTDPASTPTPTATPTATPTSGPTATPTPTSSASSSATFTYDANGNMTTDGTKCYHYNEANQLDKVTKCSGGQTIAEYVYDLKGDRMVKKNYTNGTLTNTVTSWSDSYETKVIEGGATENTAYYFANGQLVGKKDKDGNRTYVHSDHLGSTRLITNQAGVVVESTAYDPWGEVKSGGTKSKFLYTGQEKDDETGLMYYNARYYDPDIRRFTQPDNIVEDVYDPQTLNRYSYVRNNPLKYIDPSGHSLLSFLSNIITSIFKPAPKPVSTLSPTAVKAMQNIPKNSIPTYNSPISSSQTHAASATPKNTNASQNSSKTNMVNGISTQINNSKQTTIRSSTSVQSTSQAKSYIDIGASSGIVGPFGGGAGIQINSRGVSPYLAGGLVTPGKGITALYSPGQIDGKASTLNVSAAALGAFNKSYPLSEDVVPLTSSEDSYGVGFPVGASITVNKNLGFYTWADLLSD